MQTGVRLLAASLALLVFSGVMLAAGAAKQPQLLDRAPIRYPRSELPNETQGFVTIAVEVLESGLVGMTRVERSSKVAAFDEAALAGVRRWVFAPALDAAGKPVAANFAAVIAFRPGDAREWNRLMRIYADYHFFIAQNDTIFGHCEKAGVDVSAARKAVEPDAATLERVRKLTDLFQEHVARGRTAAEATAWVARVRDDAYANAETLAEDQFRPWSAAEASKHCRETIASAVELGFLYPGSDELLEF